MADLIIRNASVLDGTGAAAVEADVAITGDRITAVGSISDSAPTEIDAGGRTLAPGFVDVHTHDDGALLRHPGMEFKLSQGCTSLVIGNCGFSAIPAVPGESDKSGLIGVTPTWTDLDGFRASVTKANPAVNAMALVGHNTTRSLVMGLERRVPSDTELDEMRSYVRAA
ncbi:MAG: amidohydrolase family protein, partial [Acidimicrobiales bacterium]